MPETKPRYALPIRAASLAAVAVIGLAGAALERLTPTGAGPAATLTALAHLWLRTALTITAVAATAGAIWLAWIRYRPDLGTPRRAWRRSCIRRQWDSVARSCGLAVTKDHGTRHGANILDTIAGSVDRALTDAADGIDRSIAGRPPPTSRPASKASSPAKPATLERLPKLRRGRASIDRILVTYRLRPARGQTVEDVADAAPAIADSLGLERVTVRRTGPGRGELDAYLGNPFHAPKLWEPVILDHPAIPWGTDDTGATTVLPLGAGHALGAGATGSGKSGLVNSLVASAGLRPDVAIVGIDIKGGVELGPWRDRMTDLAVDPARAAALIAELADLVRWRYTEMNRLGVRKMTTASDGIGPWVLVVIDELSELLDSIDKGDLVSIARLARACGIVLAVFTQRPSAQTLSMDLRDQLDAVRWCGRVPPKSTTGAMVLGDDCAIDPSTIDKRLRGLGVLDDADGVRLARPWWLDDQTGHLAEVAASVAHLRIPPEVVFPWRTGSRGAA